MSMYPEQPPLCTTTGTECQPCPAGAEPRNGRYLALGQTIVEQKIEISGLQEDIAHLTLDPKLPNTLNLAGLYLHAQQDPNFQLHRETDFGNHLERIERVCNFA